MDNLELNYLLIQRSSSEDLKAVEYVFSKQKGETNTQILFNLLLEEKVFDAERIINRWRLFDKKKPLTTKALENTKTNLKTILLEAIGIKNQFVIGGDAEKALYHAEAYIQRQFFMQAFQVLDSALEDNSIFMYPNYRVTVIQKVLWLLPLLKLEAAEKKREHYLVFLQSAMDEIQLFYEVFVFNNAVFELVGRNVIMKSADSKAELRNLLKHNLVKFNQDKLPHTSAVYLTKTKINLHYLASEPLKQFDLQMDFCTMLRKYDKQYLQSSEYLNYVGEFTNLATLAVQLQKDRIFSITIQYLKSIISLNKQYFPVFQAQVLLLEAMQYYYTKNYEVMLPLLEKADNYIVKTVAGTPALHSDNFKLGLMKCWLAVKNYPKVKYWFGNRTGIKPIVRLDSYFIIYVIYVCSLYEQFIIQNKTLVLPNGFKNWVENLRSMQKNNRMFLPLESAVIETLMQLADSDKKEMHLKLLTVLAKKMQQLPILGHVYQEQFYRIFDLKGWIHEMIGKLKKK